MSRRRIVLAAGYTAGHINLALATAAAFLQSAKLRSLLFIGNADGLEAKLVPAAGLAFEAIAGSPYQRTGVAGKLLALWNLGVGTVQARRLLARHGAHLVIGFGAYASAAPLLAAKSLGIATALHESNLVPGLTNRLFGRIVDRVYVAREPTAALFPAAKTRVVGNPLRPEIAALRDETRRMPSLSRRPLRVLVTGGSRGSGFLNTRAAELFVELERLGTVADIWHQAGGAIQAVQASYARARLSARVDAYVNDMGEAYRWADLVISSAGALTTSELSTVGVPAVLVPLAAAAEDHQRENAMWFTERGGGYWVSEEQWCARELAEKIRALIADPRTWRAAARKSSESQDVDAARALVEDCEALMGARS